MSMNETTTKTLTGKLYHKATWEGFGKLIQGTDYTQYLCCSTADCAALMYGREVVVVLKAQERTGEYCKHDADARKGFSSCDEFQYWASGEIADEIEEVIIPIGKFDIIWDYDEKDEDIHGFKLRIMESFPCSYREATEEEMDWLNF